MSRGAAKGKNEIMQLLIGMYILLINPVPLAPIKISASPITVACSSTDLPSKRITEILPSAERVEDTMVVTLRNSRVPFRCKSKTRTVEGFFCGTVKEVGGGKSGTTMKIEPLFNVNPDGLPQISADITPLPMPIVDCSVIISIILSLFSLSR